MEKSKPDIRIMHITRNMPPLVGGMERLNWHMANELSKRSRLHIVAPESARCEIKFNSEFSGVPLQPLWLFILRSLIISMRTARKFRPNIIIAGSGLTAPIAWIAAKACGAQSIVYLHGLDITVNHAIYKWLWLPFIRRMDKTIANSSFTANLAVAAGITPSSLTVIYPGVELPNHSDLKDDPEFLFKHGLSGRKILLSVGRLAERKGLLEFVSYSLPQIVKKIPEAILVVIGDSPKDSLHAKRQNKQVIIETARERGLSNNIKFLGKVSNETLISAYREASVHVFPVKHNIQDPEGFGMVAIEAAAYGLPTAAFATGGIIDAVSDGVSGLLSDPGDYGALTQNILDLLENKNKYQKGSIEFSGQFDWKIFGKQLSDFLEQDIKIS